MKSDEIQIPTMKENPKGLHQRYKITKADGTPCDLGAVYFVLRLDGFALDLSHVRVSRIAARIYAKEAQTRPHLRQIGNDLIDLIDRLEKSDETNIL